MPEMLTVMLMASTATVVVQVYTAASDVLMGLNWSVRVFPVRTAPTLILLNLVSSGVLPLPTLTAIFLHAMLGSTTSFSTTLTTHVRMRENPGDMMPLVVMMTVGGGRAGVGTDTVTSHTHSHDTVEQGRN